LYNFQTNDYLIGCASEHDSGYNGIIQRHAYQVLRVLPQLPLITGERVDIIQVRSPWERGEWTGDWSRTSPVWDLVAPAVRRTIGADNMQNDGSFFMLFEHFCSVFDRIYLCKPNLDGYNSVTVRDKWVSGVSSGGSADCGTWSLNPQYKLTVDRPVYAFLVLSQGDVRRAYSPEGAFQPIGFSLFSHCESGMRIMFAEGLSPHGKLLDRAWYIEMRQRALPYHLTPEDGPYVVVPAMYRPEMESSFLLSVFADAGAKVTLEPIRDWPYVKRFTGRWTEKMSGGCSNFPTWHKNPSFTIRSYAPPGTMSEVTFVLTTDVAQRDFANAPSVGLYVLQGTDVVGHSASFAQHICHVAPFAISDEGKSPLFNVLLATFNPGVQVGFVLSVSSDYPFDMVPDDED